MIKKIATPLLLMLILLSGCLKEPDPIPETIDTYHKYYNFLLEPYPVQWEIDEVIIGIEHSYGYPAAAIVSLYETPQDVLIVSRISEGGMLLDTLSHTLFESAAYMIAILGTEEEPNLICEQIETHAPALGKIKFRFLHTAPALGPVDIYIGGDTTENKVFSGLDYSSVSEYGEATEIDMWESVIITPANSLPADSSILSYTANSIFRAGSSYLCTIGHSNSSIESSYEMQVDDQPIY
jgi:hypothetical protein